MCQSALPNFVNKASIGIASGLLSSVRFCSESSSLEASRFTSMARLHKKQGDWEKALDMYAEAIKIQKSVSPQNESLGVSYNNAGALFFDAKNYEKALEFYEEAYNLQYSLNPDSEYLVTYSLNLANVHNALGVAALEEKDFTSAENHFAAAGAAKRADEISTEQLSVAVSCNNEGTLSFNKKDYENALKCFTKAIEIEQKQNASPENLVTYRKNLANTLFALGLEKKSTEHFEKALILNEELSGREEEANACHYQMASIYEENGDNAKALEHLKKAY